MTKRDACEEFLFFWFGNNISDNKSDFELEPSFMAAIWVEMVLLATCQLQAVTIKTFNVSPPFETATKRTKRRMEQWGTPGFPELSLCTQR